MKSFDAATTFVAPVDDGTPITYLTTDADEPADSVLRQGYTHQATEVIPFPGEATGFAFYRLGSNLQTQLLRQAQLNAFPATLPNGIRIVGYTVASRVSAGGKERLTLYWEVTSPPPTGEDDAFFTHLVDDHGNVWGRLDELGYPPYYWQPGELVLSLFDIDVDPSATASTAQIELGMYRRSDTGRLAIQTADGTTADHVLLGPIQVLPKSQ